MVQVWAVASAAFLASAVEMVEALTIVLAVIYTHGIRPAFEGTIAALVALGVLVAIGVPILHVIPDAWLKVGVGAFALWFGWGWLRKAVLRASGRMAHRNEAAAYEKKVAGLQQAEDLRIGRTTAFSGVFLEGLEVALIVLAIGGASVHSLFAAVIGATAALVIVVAAGIALHAPLSRVPENVMKYFVGVMLTTFGVYWIGEGLGLAWPGDDLALLWLAATIFFASLVAVRINQSARVRSA
ncbi:MAG: COG4280 domain-containing protein [Vulcanimicrobiaceae bacterium]